MSFRDFSSARRPHPPGLERRQKVRQTSESPESVQTVSSAQQSEPDFHWSVHSASGNDSSRPASTESTGDARTVGTPHTSCIRADSLLERTLGSLAPKTLDLAHNILDEYIRAAWLQQMVQRPARLLAGPEDRQDMQGPAFPKWFQWCASADAGPPCNPAATCTLSRRSGRIVDGYHFLWLLCQHPIANQLWEDPRCCPRSVEHILEHGPVPEHSRSDYVSLLQTPWVRHE